MALKRVAAGLATAGAFALFVLLAWPSSSGTAMLLQFLRPYSLADGQVVYQPNRARISFLPVRMLEMEYPPSYNNNKLREAACFGFDRNPGNAVPWTPDDHALWCEPADGTRIGAAENRGDEELRTGRLIGEGNALIDFNEYNNVDSSMGEAQREVVDRI